MRTNPPPDRRLIYLLNVAQRRVQRFVAGRRRGATPAQSGLLFVLGDSVPHDYRVAYLGYSGDGHFGRWNLSAISPLCWRVRACINPFWMRARAWHRAMPFFLPLECTGRSKDE